MRFNKEHNCKIKQWEKGEDKGSGSLVCCYCNKQNIRMIDIFFWEKNNHEEIFCDQCFIMYLTNERFIESSGCDEHDKPLQED